MITFNLMFETSAELVEVCRGLMQGGPVEIPIAVKRAAAEATEKEPEPPLKEEAAAVVEAAKSPKEEPKAAEAPKFPSTQDIRNAMMMVREKLEYGKPAPGETKGPNAEADDTVHRELTKVFKATAHSIAACKPSELPEDKRQEFIDAISTLQLNDDNTITPF